SEVWCSPGSRERELRTGPGNTNGGEVLTIFSLGVNGVVFAGEHLDAFIGTWSNALHEPDLGVPGLANAGFNNQTHRQIVHVSVGGPWVRVRLSTFGAGSLVLGAAHIALGSTASIVPGSDRTLTFGGSPSITIPPGALVVSDPVELDVPDQSDLAVSVFLPENTGPATWHFERRQTSFISIPGDFSASQRTPPLGCLLQRASASRSASGVDVVKAAGVAPVALPAGSGRSPPSASTHS